LRLDLFLVEKKLVTSRTQAQDLISSGFVFLKKNHQNIPLTKSNYQVTESDHESIFVEKNEIQKFVSRGGLKLEKALKKINLDLTGKSVFDIGQSTGGFTDCLLYLGAKSVVGIDVGHDQLHAKIKTDARVTSFEGLHVKDLDQNQSFQKAALATGQGFDLLVADVSFISLTKVMPVVKKYLKPQGYFLFLVKPQFELTSKDLDRNGIVKDAKKYGLVQNVIEQEARQQFGDVIDYFQSETPGKDGNQEFFIYGKKTI